MDTFFWNPEIAVSPPDVRQGYMVTGHFVPCTRTENELDLLKQAHLLPYSHIKIVEAFVDADMIYSPTGCIHIHILNFLN